MSDDNLFERIPLGVGPDNLGFAALAVTRMGRGLPFPRFVDRALNSLGHLGFSYSWERDLSNWPFLNLRDSRGPRPCSYLFAAGSQT